MGIFGKFFKKVLGIKSPQQQKSLSKREKKLIFKLANDSGCDFDGDELRLYVNEAHDVVRPLNSLNRNPIGFFHSPTGAGGEFDGDELH